MKIAYITYWSITEGLSQATSIPNLKILDSFDEVGFIDYYTFEKDNSYKKDNIAKKINHCPLKRGNGSGSITKIKDYLNAWKILQSNHKEIKYDLVIARSSFSGIFAYFLFLIYRIPFVVESFEPHSEYQINIPNGWKKQGFRYLFLYFFEYIQKKYAILLMPVSFSYKRKLIDEGVSEIKIIVQPCCVDYSKIKFNYETRKLIRTKLNIKADQLVGIYAGKFGGLYYDIKAFELIGDLYKNMNNKLSLILLTPNDKNYLIKELSLYGVPTNAINILYVERENVFDYLMAADFAFNFHITSKVSSYFSPIKNAEYWAAGLPIIVPLGVGDDWRIVNDFNVGIVHDFKTKISLSQVELLNAIMQMPNSRMVIRNKTLEFRSIDLIKASYCDMFLKTKNK